MVEELMKSSIDYQELSKAIDKRTRLGNDGQYIDDCLKNTTVVDIASDENDKNPIKDINKKLISQNEEILKILKNQENEIANLKSLFLTDKKETFNSTK